MPHSGETLRGAPPTGPGASAPLGDPEAMRLDELEVEGGLRLRIAVADPAGTPRASLVLLHGRTEFIEKYAEVIRRLTSAGYRVFTLDWRGQGLSHRLLADRRKGHLERYDDLLGDLDLFLERVVAPAREGPLVMLAHSMGGHVGLCHLYRDRGRFDGAIFASPLWDLRFYGARRLGVELLVGSLCILGAGGRYVPGMSDYDPANMPFDDNPLTGDRRRYQRTRDLLAADPRLALGGPTLGWLRATLRSVAGLKRLIQCEPLELPLLVLSGQKDLMIDVASHRCYAARLARAEYVGYPEGRHELLQETDDIFEDALARVLAFVERLAGG